MTTTYITIDKFLKRHHKLLRFFDAGKMFPDEYFKNVLWMLVDAERSAWAECIAAIPPSRLSEMAQFARSYLEPVDFMPNPGIVNPSNNSAEAISVAKQYYRPIYLDLLPILEENARRGEE